MENKRILYIVAFIVLVIAFGAMIYFVFLRDLVSPANTNNATIPANGNANATLPNINGAANVNRINVNGGVNVNVANVNVPVSNVNVAPTPVAQGGVTIAKTVVDSQVDAAQRAIGVDGIRYYDRTQGKFFRLGKDGKAQPMTDQLFPNASRIAWSPTGNKAAISFPDQSKIIYDFDSREQVTLPKQWDDIEFSPSGEQIAFKNMAADENSRWLAVAKTNGAEVELIEPIGDKAGDVAVSWSPSGQVVASFREGYSGTQQEVFLLGLHGENFKSFLTDGRGFQGVWSPTGTQLLYSVYSAASQYNPSLFLVDADGDQIGANEITLGLQTWPTRCAFTSTATALYCAVPTNLPTGSGLSPSIATATKDAIYRIDANTGSRNLVALPSLPTAGTDYSITAMFLSADAKTLYFNDGNSGKLFSVQLP
ncbi:MAG: hypothetical protein V1916_01120 [Patescibacteria group bacterium]